MAVIVFDNDDTLMMNEWQYSQAIERCFTYFYEIFRDFAPNRNALNARYIAIDKQNFAKWGIRRGRVAETKRMLYEEVCAYAERRGLKFSKKARAGHLSTIEAIGDLPFDYTKMRWRPGVERALGTLRKEGNTLCLLTSYDGDVFPKKAEFMKIGRFFDPAHVRAIGGSKKKEDFVAVSGWTENADVDHEWFAVGNGESDIRPALEISSRWRGVYIPHGSTSPIFEDGKESNPWPEPLNHFMPPPIVHDRVKTVMELDSRLAFEELREIVNNADEYV